MLRTDEKTSHGVVVDEDSSISQATNIAGELMENRCYIICSWIVTDLNALLTETIIHRIDDRGLHRKRKHLIPQVLPSGSDQCWLLSCESHTELNVDIVNSNMRDINIHKHIK